MRADEEGLVIPLDESHRMGTNAHVEIVFI